MPILAFSFVKMKIFLYLCTAKRFQLPTNGYHHENTNHITHLTPDRSFSICLIGSWLDTYPD